MTDAKKLLEQVLILRAQSGDDAAFVRLVDRYHPRLLYYVKRLLGGGADAEDVMQGVWLDAYNQLYRLKAPEAFSVWLYRIARNKAVQNIRSERTYAPIEDANEVAAPEEEEPTWSPEDAALVTQALDALSHDHREALTLRFMEEMSYDEIAEITGCSIGTVRSRLHYAKRQVRKFVEENRHE